MINDAVQTSINRIGFEQTIYLGSLGVLGFTAMVLLGLLTKDKVYKNNKGEN